MSTIISTNTHEHHDCDVTSSTNANGQLDLAVNFDNLDEGGETNVVCVGDLLEQKPVLNEQHLQDLRNSGLSDETIKVGGFRSLTPEQAGELGFLPGHGYLIPYPASEGYIRIRYDE